MDAEDSSEEGAKEEGTEKDNAEEEGAEEGAGVGEEEDASAVS